MCARSVAARIAYIICCAALAFSSPVIADVELQEMSSFAKPAPRTWSAWGLGSLVVSDTDLREVTWTASVDARDRLFDELPVPASLVESWGDSLLVQVPGEGGRLYDRRAFDPTDWNERPSNWHLPNTLIGGEPYRYFVDPLFYLIVFSAPGPGGILSLFDFEETIGVATDWAWDGDRVMLAHEGGVMVIDTSTPLSPAIASNILPPADGDLPRDVAVRGHVGFVNWGDHIASYDLGGSGALPPLDEILADTDQLALGGRWLVSWSSEPPYLNQIHDTLDPANLTFRATIETSIALDGAEVHVEGDRIEIRHALGLVAYRVPGGTAPLESFGYAWPLLQGWPLAAAGQTAWLQGPGARFVIDAGQMTVPLVQDRVGGEFGAMLQAVGEVLYDHPGAGEGVRIESLADPLAPTLLTVLDPTPAIQGFDVAGARLAAAADDRLVLYDVSDPAAPVRQGELALDGEVVRVIQHGDTAVVIGRRVTLPDFAHIVDIGDMNAPQLIVTLELDPAPELDAFFHDIGLVSRGDDVHVQIDARGGPGGGIDAYTATIDLTDPQMPQVSYAGPDSPFWCYAHGEDDGEEPLLILASMPVAIGDYHISFRDDTVTVYTLGDGAGMLEPVSTWQAPGPVTTLAAAGTTLLVLSEHRLDRLSLSDTGIIGVPDTPVAMAVRAVPNPFNPQTEITFELRRAGPVDVAIHDIRGRQVRRLRAELPAGPASLTWRGTDEAGRALPSGTYLLRVTTPDGVYSSRCALVR